jgi:hypothetical protein
MEADLNQPYEVYSVKKYANGGSFAPNVADGTAFMDNAYFASGGNISVYNLRKGDKVKTRKGDIETILRKTGSGSYETIENDYSHSPESLEFVSRPSRKMAEGGSFAPNVADGTQFMDGVYADGGKLKKYIDHDDIKSVSFNVKGNIIKVSGDSVLNGANMFEDGGDLTKIANYIPKRDVVEVELKDGSKIKPVNGYWLKKDWKTTSAKAGYIKDSSAGSGNEDFKIGDYVKKTEKQGSITYGTEGFIYEINRDFSEIKLEDDYGNKNPKSFKLKGFRKLKSKSKNANVGSNTTSITKIEQKESFADGGAIGSGKNGYVAFYKGKRIEVYADTMYEAQKTASQHFKARKDYDVNVVLAEVDGKPYINSTMFADGGSFAPNVSDGTAFMDNAYFADGGGVSGYDNSSYQKLHAELKSRVVRAIGIDSAIDFYDAEYPIRPYQLLEKAVRKGFITLDEINERVVDSAMETAQDSEDMDEIGSSDETYFMQEFLDEAGFKTVFVEGRLLRVYSDGGFMNNVYADGGDLSNVELNFTFDTEGDAELEYPQEVEKIKLLRQRISFDEVRGSVDYGKTKDNTDLKFYKKGELVMTLKGDYDTDSEILDTDVEILGSKHKINYHPYDGMGGVDYNALKSQLEKTVFADGGSTEQNNWLENLPYKFAIDFANKLAKKTHKDVFVYYYKHDDSYAIDTKPLTNERKHYELKEIVKYSDGGFMNDVYAKGGEVADIQKMKNALIRKAKSRGLYENFGQKEVRVLEDKYGYTNNVRDFDDWAMNYDLSQMADGGFMNDVYAKGGELKGKFLAEIIVPYNYEKVVKDEFEFTEFLSKTLTKKWFHNGLWVVKIVKPLFEKDFSQKIVVEIEIPSGVTEGGSLGKFEVGEFISKTLTKKWFGNGIWGVDIVSSYADGGMFDDNDGFMKADNNRNFRYPEMKVNVETLDEPIDLTDNVSYAYNEVTVMPLNDEIDLRESNNMRVGKPYVPKNRTPQKMMAVNPRMIVTDMPMPTSNTHKND